jgi:hypothetical protein
MPGRPTSARRTEAIPERLTYRFQAASGPLPEFQLRDSRKAEFPAVFRLVDTSPKTLSLFFL